MKSIKPVINGRGRILRLAIAMVFGAGSIAPLNASTNKTAIPPMLTSANGQVQTSSTAPAAFVPNQIVIKLKSGASLGTTTASVATSAAAMGIANSNLNSLMQKHGVAKSEPLLRPGHANRSGAQVASAAAQTTAHGLDRIYLLTVQGKDVEAIAKEFARDPAVEYAEPNHIATVQMVPNDTYYNTSGSFSQSFSDLWGVKAMSAEAAWDVTQGAGITVAVIDTGVDIAHEDLAANIWVNAGEIPGNGIDDDLNGYVDDVNGYDFVGANMDSPAPDSDPSDPYGHGTHVAGIVAAVGNNNKGVIGVAPKAKIMAVRALDNRGSGTDFQIAQAITYAADRGARVINMSLGGGGASTAEANAIAYATNLGAVVIAAAGNNRVDANYFTPANDSNVITVGAISPSFDLAFYSNFGPKIDVVAPGSDILSTLAPGSAIEQELLNEAAAGRPLKIVGQKYAAISGTSMAAPMVSGTVALLLAKSPSLSLSEVRYRLKKNAVDMGTTSWDAKFGSGRVNTTAALADTSAASRTRAFIRTPSVGVAAPSNIWVSGQNLTVTGSALGAQSAGYELAYAAKSGDAVGSFVTIGSGASAIDGNLGMLNTAALADGDYILRLTARDSNGTSSTAYGNIIKDSKLRPGWPSMASSWLGYADGARQEAKALSFADLDNDGFKEVITARGKSIFAWHRDGTKMPGFPVTTTSDITAPLAIADIDGDGKQEIVGLMNTVFATPIIAINFDGSVKAGFPAGKPGTSPRVNDILYGAKAPAVVDLDGDGKKEIIFTAQTMSAFTPNYMYINVIGYNGQQKAGWPKQVDISSYPSHEPSKVTVADLNNDGKVELMMTSLDASGQLHITVYSDLGALKQDVVVGASSDFVLPDIAVADMNKDGSLEVFVGTRNKAYLYNNTLSPVAGWPKSVSEVPFFSNAYQTAMIDVEGNGDIEAVYLSRPTDFSGGILDTSPQVMHAFKLSGAEAAGYPNRFDPLQFPPEGGSILYTDAISQLVDAPLANSPGSSIFLNSYFTNFVGRTGAATALSGWPKVIPMSSNAPAVGDLDNDGKWEIGTFANDGMVYIYSETGAANKVPSWPTVNANNARTNTIPTTGFLKTYPQVYLRGTNNNWVGTAMTQTGNYTWQIDANFGSTTTERFKFDIYNNWATNFGDNNVGCASNCVAEQTGSDIQVKQGAGTYRIIFNDQTKAYSLVKQGVNIAPTANAGPDQIATLNNGSVTVNFNGSASLDTDGTIVSYSWSNGLTGANPSKTYNVAGTYTVTLTVTDNLGATGTDTVVIQVKAPNQAPIARAGNDQTVSGAATVTLNGSTSSDADGSITTYQWVQTAGPAVTIQNANQAIAQVTLPAYPGMPTTFGFRLTVTDNGGLSSSSTTNVQQIEGSFQSTYSTMYFRGTPNNWLGNKPMTLVANYTWQIDIPFSGAASDRFKFDVAANWATNFGDNNKDGVADSGGGDIYVTVAGTYRIRFNDQTKVYTVVKL